MLRAPANVFYLSRWVTHTQARAWLPFPENESLRFRREGLRCEVKNSMAVMQTEGKKTCL